MAKARLNLISLTVDCECGHAFLAEDFEPECPYCNRMYVAKLLGSEEKVALWVMEERAYSSTRSRIEARRARR